MPATDKEGRIIPDRIDPDAQAEAAILALQGGALAWLAGFFSGSAYIEVKPINEGGTISVQAGELKAVGGFRIRLGSDPAPEPVEPLTDPDA